MANVVKFNGKELPDWVRVTGVTLPVLPEISPKEHESIRRYGNVDAGVEIGGKPFSLSVLFILGDGDNLHDKAQELKAWLRGESWQTPSKLVFDESPDYYYMARVTNAVEVSDNFFYGEGTIEFKSVDGIRYREEHSETLISGQSNIVTYNGLETAPTVIEITLNEDARNLVVENSSTGKVLRLNREFKSGQSLTINSNTKEIRWNNDLAMYLLTIQSRWIYLTEGENVIKVYSDSGASVDMNIRLRYTELN